MIEINNLTTNPIDEEFFKKVAKIVLKGENKKDTDLSIALVGQGRIRELNKKYLGKNRTTDVLAFSNKEIGLGEIVICLKEVKKNAKRYLPSQIFQDKTWEGETFEKELSRILIHGLLHLLGYEHEISLEKAKQMEKKQEYYLSQVLKY